MIRIDLNACSADMLVDDQELERRRAELAAPGYVPESQTPWQAIFREKVGALADGMTLEGADAFQDIAHRHMPRDSH